MGWCHREYSFDESTSFVLSRKEAWQEGRDYTFVIFDVDTGDFVGGTGVNQINRVMQFGNLGHWVRSSRTGRGAATAAARLAARFGFEHLGLHRVEIVVHVENEASHRVAEKVGARREGLLRNRLLLHGEPRDAVMYSLVPADVEAWSKL